MHEAMYLSKVYFRILAPTCIVAVILYAKLLYDVILRLKQSLQVCIEYLIYATDISVRITY